MNYLGIDYGTKRIGLSIGDDELRLAVPTTCLKVGQHEDTLHELQKIIHERRIDSIVIGYPINMDETIGFKAKEVDAFIERLQALVKVPITRIDERLSSESVGDLRQRSGKNRQTLRRIGAIDSAAAVIILQDFFDQQILQNPKQESL